VLHKSVQFKYHLYHVGLLTNGGTDNKSEVLDNEWQLEKPIGVASESH
jgi:hypothetical protein